jgi:type IV secretory pathway protease TraF
MEGTPDTPKSISGIQGNTTTSDSEVEDWQRLQAIAQSAAQTGRLPLEQTRRLITELCAGRYLSAEQIGRLLNRNAESIRNRFLTPMAKENILILKHPEEINRPDQAYTRKTL